MNHFGKLKVTYMNNQLFWWVWHF